MTEYQIKEAEFMARTDSLCETVKPVLCDCSTCPTREMCEWLCANAPAK